MASPPGVSGGVGRRIGIESCELMAGEDDVYFGVVVSGFPLGMCGNDYSAMLSLTVSSKL